MSLLCDFETEANSIVSNIQLLITTPGEALPGCRVRDRQGCGRGGVVEVERHGLGPDKAGGQQAEYEEQGCLHAGGLGTGRYPHGKRMG